MEYLLHTRPWDTEHGGSPEKGRQALVDGCELAHSRKDFLGVLLLETPPSEGQRQSMISKEIVP